MGVDISYLTASAHDPFSVCKYIFDAKKNNENISKSAFNKKTSRNSWKKNHKCVSEKHFTKEEMLSER